MFNTGYGGTGDFEALARQYWGAWGNAMRQAGLGAVAPPPPPQDPWHQAMDWWSRLLPQGPSQVDDTLGRFNQQARDWFGQMQQVAAQFAGRDSSPGEIGQAWRQALGARGANPFAEMFKAMSGKSLHGLDDWTTHMQPFLDNLPRD
ncbi:MAG TPA: poly(R)-hydroxyalkanoic acid synthase subunit PhaE, partial [Roseococcus sp.]|nr:poly(R)-hydroxyalkanoic acid synthase subunit PhaE [Roseococcus sp.]